MDSMITIKSVDAIRNFKDICATAYNGEAVTVSRPHNENVVVISESKYHQMEKLFNDYLITEDLVKTEAAINKPNAKYYSIEKTMKLIHCNAKI